MTETTARPMFDDADLTHRWATEHRIPVVTLLPRWLYEAALLVPHHGEGETPDPDAFRLRESVWPTDAEAAVIGSYIDYRMECYREGWRQRARAQTLDVVGSTNTVTFCKTEKGWTYSRLTYGGSFYPRYDQPQFEGSKAGLIALIVKMYAFGSEVYAPFAEWMAGHPDVWALPEQ